MPSHILPINHGNFEVDYSNYIGTRTYVSNGLYSGLRFLVVLLLGCSVAFGVFQGIQLGESLAFKVGISALFVAIEGSLVFFAAVVYPDGVRWVACLIAGVGVIALSVMTTAGFLLSQQYAQEHKLDDVKRAYVERLQTQASMLSVTNVKDRGSLGILNNRIEEGLRDLDTVKGSKSTAFFHGLSATSGYSVEAIQFLGVILVAITSLTTSIALSSYLERLYCSKSLVKWSSDYQVRHKILSAAHKMITGGGPIALLSEDSESLEMVGEEGESRYRRQSGGGDELSESVYQRIKSGLISRELQPSVASIKRAARGSDNAYQAIDRLKREGVLFQAKNGRYGLAQNCA